MSRLESLLDFLYPPLCALCETSATGSLCPVCVGGVAWVGGRPCRRCGAGRIGRGCRECFGREFRFDGAVALGSYEGVLRELLLQFKLGGKIHLARDLGRRLAQRVLDEGLPVDGVTAVPMTWRALLRRGYNPAEELARSVSAAVCRPFWPLLRKRRSTKPQATLPVREREVNPVGAYVARKTGRIRGATVLLVDDVLTTGATAGECSRVLREAGARAVYLAIVGR